MISTISLKTDLGAEIIINDDFSDIANLMESVTTLLFASGYSLQTIRFWRIIGNSKLSKN